MAFVYYDKNRPMKTIPEFADERPVELDKIQRGDIWLHASRSFLGLGIRTLTINKINHAGQIVDDNFIIHALPKGLTKEPFGKYINNPSCRVTVLRVKDDVFKDKHERGNILNLVIGKAERLYKQGIRYNYGMIGSFAVRSLLRFTGLYGIKKVRNVVDQKREDLICSQFVDDVWDELEKIKNLDLFMPHLHPTEITPADIIISPYASYVTGWYYNKYFQE